MSTFEIVATVLAFLAAVLPAVIKLAHELGYELPILTRLADLVANLAIWVAERRASDADLMAHRESQRIRAINPPASLNVPPWPE